MNNAVKHFTADGTEYPVLASLNVMEWAQETFGSYEEWFNRISPPNPYAGLFNGNYTALSSFGIGYKGNKVGMMQLLIDAEKIANRKFDRQKPEDIAAALEIIFDDKEVSPPEASEPDMKIIKKSFCMLINEGIDYENLKKGEKREHITETFCGYILPMISGLAGAKDILIGAITGEGVGTERENTEDSEKNS